MRNASKAALPLALAAMVGCAPLAEYARDPIPDGPAIVVTERRPDEAPDRLGIRPDELPRPGECRTWYPGLRASRQPQPESCTSLASNVPVGAWLLSRPAASIVRVSVRPPRASGGRVIALRDYDAVTGRPRSTTPYDVDTSAGADASDMWHVGHLSWRSGDADSSETGAFGAATPPVCRFLARNPIVPAGFPTSGDWHPSCPVQGACLERNCSAAAPDYAWLRSSFFP